MAPQYTLDCTGAAATVLANTLDYGDVQWPFAYNGGAVATTVTNTLTVGTSSYLGLDPSASSLSFNYW